MKLLLISGHGAGASGATAEHNGIAYREADLTREVTAWLAAEMEKYCETDIYPIDRDAFQDANSGRLAVDFSEYDYILEIHFNAIMESYSDGETKGTELYVINSKRIGSMELAIVKNIVNCGFRNRGVKINPFLVIRTAERAGTPAALLEVCFIDDPDDMAVYNAQFGNIVYGIRDALVPGLNLGPAEGGEIAMPKFNDVRPDAWYSSAVDYVADKGLMDGVGNNRFDPNGAVTRAQLATVVARLHEALTKTN
ncbi:MAG: N-acetylmuramoyl-L-alanine amidase [Oscillospiraceae bacterium]|nr:N-acetylmuramoyl-L-alanine amidase [Oscillospiraceae bacterium]